MYLETERLIIRDLLPEDAQPFIDMISDGSVQDVFKDYQNPKDWIADWIAEANQFSAEDDPSHDYLAYAIADKNTNIAIGSIGCTYYEDLHKIGIVYCIAGRHRRKGYAAEAVSAYMGYFFRHYEIDEMSATIRADNIASCKTAEKTGFTLVDSRMYQDMSWDATEELTNFYILKRT